MSGEHVAVALGAATATGCAVVGLIFLRHWRSTGDALFGFFAAAFGLMAANRVALVVVGETHEASTSIYLVRFAAFLLIVLGIVRKNTDAARRPPAGRPASRAEAQDGLGRPRP